MIYFIIFLVTIIVLIVVIDPKQIKTGNRFIVKFYLLLILNEIVITSVKPLHFL